MSLRCCWTHTPPPTVRDRDVSRRWAARRGRVGPAGSRVGITKRTLAARTADRRRGQ